ncbi:MAG: hypothetical protein EBS76_05515, partial [Actinobacteria bacterium]|nr:hypothetical protein [Actinomycetota bacterium]
EIDGRDVPVQFKNDGLVGCHEVIIEEGSHRLVTTPGHISGVHIDSLVLDSGSGVHNVNLSEASLHRTSTQMEITIDAGGQWLVVNESFSEGWSAQSGGIDLGEPLLVNGYAMAWWIPESVSGVVTLRWGPQRWVNLGLLISAAMTVGLIFLAAQRKGIKREEVISITMTPRGASLIVLSTMLLGLPALLAIPVRRCSKRVRLILAGMVIVPMWLWTSVRQVRWDMPVDMRWPSSMSWAQWGVIVIVVSCCWSALDRE